MSGHGFDHFPSLIRAAIDAEAAFDAAHLAWEEAQADYRVAWHEMQRPIVDEWGLRTGEVEPLTRVEQFDLSRLEQAEDRAWDARAAAKTAWERAERVLNGGLA